MALLVPSYERPRKAGCVASSDQTELRLALPLTGSRLINQPEGVV